ncbi:MAG: ABC transporter substrate-binding protein [Candidatus Thorarchaeota archaeon]
MERNQTIAIVVIIVIIAGAAVGYYMFMIPPEGGPVEQVLIMGTTDSVESSLDIAQSYDYFGWEIIGSLSSGLVEIQPGSEAGADDINPALALSWVPSSGGTVWDFTLREGVLFEDGREFNATDVVYTFERNCNLTGDGLYEGDGPQLNMGYGDIIDNVTATGEFTVRFELNIAFAPFLQLMAAQSSFMVDRVHAPKATLVAYTQGENRTSHPGGLGPFLLEEWSRIGGTDERIVLVKNPDYWNAAAGLPKADKITIVMYASDTALASAMTSGEIDIAYRQLTAPQIESFRANPNVRVWDGIGAQIQYMCFQQATYPYNITGVRQAITAALNRSRVTETVFLGTFTPLFSMIPAGMAYHKPSFEVHGSANYTFTQTELAKYGYNSTNKLVIEFWYESSGHYPQSAEQALVYEEDLEASGVIQVNLNNAEWSSYRDHRNAGDMEVFIYGWYPDFIDPDNYEFLPFASWLNMGYNATYPVGGGGEQQAALWNDGRAATTDAARQAAYYALQDLQAQEASVVPLWQSATTAVTKPTVHGVVLDITVTWRHWLLYLGDAATTGP